jgi:5'-deoxynucleotidase YfbR-like HD superfamily hydrolase
MELHELRRELERELDTFPNRTDDLRSVKRWARYPKMYYRTDLYVHGKRIAASLIFAEPVVREVMPAFNMERAILLALVHDDAELITGDFQSSNRVLMSEEALAELDTAEERAIEVLAQQYPKEVRGTSYQELLTDILNHETAEAQVVKYLDKFEGLAEAMHEIYAGNVTYGMYFKDLAEKLPRAASLAERKQLFFDTTIDQDWEAVAKAGVPHTEDSLGVAKGFHVYDDWIAAQRAAEDAEIVDSLLVMREK